MITCATCDAKHKSIFDKEYQQGDGCAATLYEHDGKRYLVGHYGSVVADMERYEVNPAAGYNLGNCCDVCITRMIDEGNATLIEEGIY